MAGVTLWTSGELPIATIFRYTESYFFCYLFHFGNNPRFIHGDKLEGFRLKKPQDLYKVIKRKIRLRLKIVCSQNAATNLGYRFNLHAYGKVFTFCFFWFMHSSLGSSLNRKKKTILKLERNNSKLCAIWWILLAEAN